MVDFVTWLTNHSNKYTTKIVAEKVMSHDTRLYFHARGLRVECEDIDSKTESNFYDNLAELSPKFFKKIKSCDYIDGMIICSVCRHFK